MLAYFETSLGRGELLKRTLNATTAEAIVLSYLVAACGSVTRAPIEASPPPPSPSPAPPLTADPLPLIIEPPASPESRFVPSATRAAPIRYGGNWMGRAVPTHCREWGGAIGAACSFVPDMQPLRLHLTQAGRRVSGVLEVGPLQVDISGTVADDGTLTVVGQHSGATQTVIVSRWRSSSDRAVMNGTFRYSILAADERLGKVTVTAVLKDLVKELD